jgi:hypothetical protein
MSFTAATIAFVSIHLQLSKSRYCYGLQCTKQFWWRVHEPKAPELTPDAAQQATAAQGARGVEGRAIRKG